MKYLNKNSLFKTVENVSEALLFHREIGEDEKSEIANFIVNQQGNPHAYANTFAPTADDLKQDLILFTGERIRTNAGKCHIIGEEASRILRKLDLNSDRVHSALSMADNGLSNQIISASDKYWYEYGTYCCKSCSCGLWLNLSAGGLFCDTDFLKAGMQFLKKNRDGSGRWKGFPYYYTLYVLNEIEVGIAMEEIEYTSKSVEKRLRRKRSSSKHDIRRNRICEHLLHKLKRD